MSFNRKYSLPLVLIFLALLTRFVGLSWGNGFFFHPDESNMARSVSGMTNDLNPHFFAYGQFPLYLAYFSQVFLNIDHSFSTSIYTLRFYSALFSCLSILVIYHISSYFFTKKNGFLFCFLLLFTPGLIQISKFGTTESLLVLVFSAIILFSIKYFQTGKFKYFLLNSLLLGIGLATKISSLIFASAFILAIIYSQKSLLKSIPKVFLYLTASLMFAVVFSPYHLIKWSDFVSASIYETSVATGDLKVFYTRQFENTLPYIFQFINIFPYVFGMPILVTSILALFIKTPKIFYQKKIEFLIIFLPSLLYFAYFGSLYTKWTRFMSPIFFCIPFLSTFYISSLKYKKIKLFITLIAIVPGILFMSIYIRPDIRLQASRWINTNLSPQAVIFSEAGNVVDIPISASNPVYNFDFYNLDQNPDLQQSLSGYLNQADYIIIPSRRIFKNQNNNNFPYSQRYYQALFSGQLGFSKVKTFSPWLLTNQENAEETFTVFDHPIIRIYQKQIPFDQNYYQQILLNYDQN